MNQLIEHVLSNPGLHAGIAISLLFSIFFLHTARRAIVRDRVNTITVPESRSCFDCDDHFVLAPGYAPQGVYSVAVKETTLQCRKMMRDEVRLTEDKFQEDWGFAFEEAPGDYVAVATKCPKFTVIQGGKK